MSCINQGFIGPSGSIVGGVGGGPGGLVAGVLEEEASRVGGARVGSGVAGEESEEGGRGGRGCCFGYVYFEYLGLRGAGQ